MGDGLGIDLTPLGLSGGEQRVYEFLIQNHSVTLQDISDVLGLSRTELRNALNTLERQGLVTASLGRPLKFSTTPPDVALEALILRRQEELERTRLTARTLAQRFQQSLDEDPSREFVHVIRGRESAAQRFVQLQKAARHEVVMFDKPPYWSSPKVDDAQPPLNEEELELLARGVKYRTLYDAAGLELPGQLDRIRAYMDAGEEARFLGGLPMKLSIYDRTRALAPLRLDQPGTEGALLIEGSSLLEALLTLFEVLWERSIPVESQIHIKGRSPRARPQRRGTSTDEDKALLLALAGGIKDEIIARQLGVGVRTVERRVKRLMHRLGAHTRFQAGLQAAKKGWI